MTLPAITVYGIVDSMLGGSMPSEQTGQQVANQAGRWLVKAHPWRWLIRPPAHLNARGSISLTAATWTEATKTLTLTGAFTTYVFLEGDEVEITSGTGATAGFYVISSRTSANAIVLATSIGSAADGQTDIAGTMQLWGVALPVDFGELVSLTSDVGPWPNESEVDFETLLQMRSRSLGAIGPLYHYAFTQADVASTTGVPVQRLELGYAPTTNDTGAILMAYRRAWPEITSDNDIVRIPVWLESLYMRCAIEYARSWIEDDEQPGTDRLDRLRGSQVWRDALRADGAISLTAGHMRGGAAAPYYTHGMRWHRSDVIVEVP